MLCRPFKKSLYCLYYIANISVTHDKGKKKIRKEKETEKLSSLGGLEPPTFRLTAERANRLRHRDNCDFSKSMIII